MFGFVIRLLVSGFMLFWAGFGVFYVWVSRGHPVGYDVLVQQTAPLPAMAIFTGDVKRVSTGLVLLQKNPKPTLITGVHPHTSLPMLTQNITLTADQLAQLTLDHSAKTTRQNMLVLKDWVDHLGVARVGLITSHYHYPRIWLLAWLLGVEFELLPVPVVVTTPFSFYLREYVKLLNVLWIK